MHKDIPSEMAALMKDRMALMTEFVRLGVIGRAFARPGLQRRRGARGRCRSIKWSGRQFGTVLTTYGSRLAADTEDALYSTITGHRPAWESA